VRNIVFHAKAFAELREWAKVDKKLHVKILDIIDNVAHSPFTGLGKPEPLKENLRGYWSRRINDEHRLIYQVEDQQITIVRCKGHYL
jgi:toxin YoeB